MNTEELTQVVTAHQSVISRVETILERIAEQQETNTQAIANLTAEQQLSRQNIDTLTSSILRSQKDEPHILTTILFLPLVENS
jgi:phage-related minor tail protein